MTDDKNEQEGLTLNASQPPANSGDVPDEHELQLRRIEEGRVSALQKQVNELTAELQALKTANEELTAKNRDYMAMLPDDLKEQVDPAQTRANAILTEKMIAERERANAETMKSQMAAQARASRNAFYDQIKAALPGFLESINPGGQYSEQWRIFYGVYGPSIDAAEKTCNLESIKSLASAFYHDIKAQLPRGAVSTPTPAPSTVGNFNGNGGGSDRVYTWAEYEELIAKAGDDKRAGLIDYKTYEATLAELNKAAREGRVKTAE